MLAGMTRLGAPLSLHSGHRPSYDFMVLPDSGSFCHVNHTSTITLSWSVSTIKSFYYRNKETWPVWLFLMLFHHLRAPLSSSGLLSPPQGASSQSVLGLTSQLWLGPPVGGGPTWHGLGPGLFSSGAQYSQELSTWAMPLDATASLTGCWGFWPGLPVCSPLAANPTAQCLTLQLHHPEPVGIFAGTWEKETGEQGLLPPKPPRPGTLIKRKCFVSRINTTHPSVSSAPLF